jgi:hypothetical protein
VAVLRELSGVDAIRWLWRYRPRHLSVWYWYRMSGPCVIMRSSRTRYYFGHCDGLSPRHGAHERDRLWLACDRDDVAAWIGERLAVVVTRNSLQVGHRGGGDALSLADVIYGLTFPA